MTTTGRWFWERRLRDALARLNPNLPVGTLNDAFRRLTRLEGPTLETRNRTFHRMLVEGVTVEYQADDGAIRGAQARIIDFYDPVGNDWLAVNQFTAVENKHERRPDIVLFVQRLTARSNRTQEPRRRRGHHLDRLAAAPDLQGGNPLAVRL